MKLVNRIRRSILMLPALLIAAQGVRAGAAPGHAAGPGNLVVYFSRSGNTRVVAGQIGRALDARVFEIIPATPYPEDYEETVAQVTRERESGYEPPLEASVENIADYDTIWLGFPIWGGSVPPVIRSFLSGHDLSGKTLIPFITHGGYGIGDSLSVLAEHASGARLAGEFVMEADQERRTLEQVTGWLGRQ